MQNYKEPLTRDQIKDLAAAATNFMLDMHERHPDAYTRITTTPWGVEIEFGGNLSVRLAHGVYAYQPLHNAAAQLDRLCQDEGWEPRILLPEWARYKVSQ